MASLQKRAFLYPLLIVIAALAASNLILSLLYGNFSLKMLLMDGLIIVAALPLLYFHGKRLIRPIKDLVPHADGIVRGRLEVVQHGSGDIPDEIRLLASAIDHIAERQTRDFAAMQKLERVRSEFLGNVSHELRTPIFAVQGFIETLLDGAIDDPNVNRDFLERARSQAQRLNALLNDLIDISRIESGEMRMSFRLFDIQPLLRSLVTEMQPMASAKKIELYFAGNVLPHNLVMVYGDKERIKQVLVNLIDNAIKYTGNGGVVKVELRDSSPIRDRATVSVNDTGYGIPAEHLPRLFERFYRVDKDRSRNQPGGTGLGLSICKHIIEKHNSKIHVTSVEGKGSTFSFTLSKHEATEEK